MRMRSAERRPEIRRERPSEHIPPSSFPSVARSCVRCSDAPCDDNDANTGGTVDATTGATSRRCHVRDENGDARPTSTVALATTPHDTKREVKGGGRRTSEETSGRRSSGRACTRARGPHEFTRFSSALKKMVVCRRRCAASLADPNMKPRTAFWAGPGKKMRAPVCGCHPKHNQTGPTRVRARYRRFYVRSEFRTFTWAG